MPKDPISQRPREVRSRRVNEKNSTVGRRATEATDKDITVPIFPPKDHQTNNSGPAPQRVEAELHTHPSKVHRDVSNKNGGMALPPAVVRRSQEGHWATSGFRPSESSTSPVLHPAPNIAPLPQEEREARAGGFLRPSMASGGTPGRDTPHPDMPLETQPSTRHDQILHHERGVWTPGEGPSRRPTVRHSHQVGQAPPDTPPNQEQVVPAELQENHRDPQSLRQPALGPLVQEGRITTRQQLRHVRGRYENPLGSQDDFHPATVSRHGLPGEEISHAESHQVSTIATWGIPPAFPPSPEDGCPTDLTTSDLWEEVATPPVHDQEPPSHWLEIIEDPFEPYPYPAPDMFFPDEEEHGEAPLVLDPIDVDVIDQEALVSMAPHLKEVLAPIQSPEAFMNLLKPGASLPQHARSSVLRQPSWTQDLIDNDVACLTRKTHLRSILTCFSIPKACGTASRFILNGRKLNDCLLSPPSFSLPSIEKLKPWIFAHEWGQVTDLRHCFYQYQLGEGVESFFGFRKRNHFYAFKRMPMGWSYAPFIAQSVAMAFIEPIARHATAIYDDFLVLGQNKQETQQRTATMRERMERCRATIHPKKAMIEAAQTLTYMGVEWDLRHKRYRLAIDFADRWAKWLTNMCKGEPHTVRAYWASAAVVLYTQRVRGSRSCNLFHLFRWLSTTARSLSSGALTWSSPCTPTGKALEDLRKGLGWICDNDWIVFHPTPPAAPIELYTDASSTGWAWLAQNRHHPQHQQVRYGRLPVQTHINVAELWTIWLALKEWVPLSPQKTWKVFCDNATAVFQIQRGRSNNFKANSILQDLFGILERHRSSIDIQWVSTQEQLADPYTRL